MPCAEGRSEIGDVRLRTTRPIVGGRLFEIRAMRIGEEVSGSDTTIRRGAGQGSTLPRLSAADTLHCAHRMPSSAWLDGRRCCFRRPDGSSTAGSGCGGDCYPGVGGRLTRGPAMASSPCMPQVIWETTWLRCHSARKNRRMPSDALGCSALRESRFGLLRPSRARRLRGRARDLRPGALPRNRRAHPQRQEAGTRPCLDHASGRTASIDLTTSRARPPIPRGGAASRGRRARALGIFQGGDGFPARGRT